MMEQTELPFLSRSALCRRPKVTSKCRPGSQCQSHMTKAKFHMKTFQTRRIPLKRAFLLGDCSKQKYFFIGA